MMDNKMTIVFSFEGTTYNMFSMFVPRIGEKLTIDSGEIMLVVLDVTYDLKKDIAYLDVKDFMGESVDESDCKK
jgi:hypothetical protein